jgi:hypothetical protein
MLEAYWAYADFEKIADLVEELICHLAQTLRNALQPRRDVLLHVRLPQGRANSRRAVRRFGNPAQQELRPPEKGTSGSNPSRSSIPPARRT